MSAERLIANLLRVAQEDLAGARILSAAHNRNAIYLCEQAAEKIFIKAVLTSEGIHGGIPHRLDVLVDQVPDVNPLKAMLRAVEDLSAFATAFRYPTPSGRIADAPDEPEFDGYARAVELVLGEAAQAFGVDLSRTDGAATSRKPAR